MEPSTAATMRLFAGLGAIWLMSMPSTMWLNVGRMGPSCPNSFESDSARTPRAFLRDSGRPLGLYWTAIWVFTTMRSTALLVIAGLGFACQLAAAPKVDFQREVRPILSDGCFLCHGPDKSTRMVNLRLDIKDGAFATRKMGRVVVPGNSKKSLLYQRVSAAGARKMPPEYSHKKLPRSSSTRCAGGAMRCGVERALGVPGANEVCRAIG